MGLPSRSMCALVGAIIGSILTLVVVGLFLGPLGTASRSRPHVPLSKTRFLKTPCNALVHTFDNGVRVERYRNVNLHEPEEEKYFVDIIRGAPHGAVFLDVGAAIGYYMILAKLLNPNIVPVGLNPAPDFMVAALENFELNGFFHLELDPWGAVLWVPDVTITKTRAGTKNVPGDASTAAGVCTTTLDELLEELGHIFLVMMDIQGVEGEVLESSRLLGTHTEWVIVGTHGEENRQRSLKAVKSFGGQVVVNEKEGKGQPDGIVIARFHGRE